ncbi:MAG: ring-opening amidohydrolase [Elainellaceae cyanobacterium]
MKIGVFKIPQSSPDDLTALDDLVINQILDPAHIVAILGKTEGNGCVNDFTRGFAVQTLKSYLAAKTNSTIAANMIYVMSGGTEGVLSPHLTVFTRQDSQPNEPQRWGLVLGKHHTRDFLLEEIGTLTMVKEVAAGVEAAIAQANLVPQDVHFVQIKCPLITAHSRSGLDSVQSAKIQDSYKSMAYSRGASALGVAVALGELSLTQINPDEICHNYLLYSNTASTSAGVELRNCEILVLGNASHSTSDFIIGHSVMQHALDVDAVQAAIANTGQPPENIVNLFAKAEADPTGVILGRRHTMLDDSDVSHTRMARAVVGAVVASAIQDPMVYVSGGSEHQGPPGGGPVAAIAYSGHAG